MVKTQFVTFCICIIFIAFSCSNNKDNKIIIEKYIYDLLNQRYSIVENSGSNPKTQNIIPLLDTIINQVEKTETISAGVKKKIYTSIINWKNDKMYDPPKSYEHLNLNKTNFLTGQMSKIETLDFIEKYFLFNYWNSWRDNDSFHELVSLVKLDTLYLKPNKEYELQIQMQYNENPSIRIISNTIQGFKPNRIKFQTNDSSKNLTKIPFSVKAINDVTREIRTIKDTIKYLTIKND